MALWAESSEIVCVGRRGSLFLITTRLESPSRLKREHWFLKHDHHARRRVCGSTTHVRSCDTEQLAGCSHGAFVRSFTRRLYTRAQALTVPSSSKFLFDREPIRHFDWTVDFDKKLIHGQVTHSILVKQESGLDTVSFDASYITLGDVLLEGHEAPLKVQVHPRHPVRLSSLDCFTAKVAGQC